MNSPLTGAAKAVEDDDYLTTFCDLEASRVAFVAEGRRKDTVTWFGAPLKRWYFRATHSRLKQVIEAANTIRRHWEGILQFVDSRITTGIVEGLNSKNKTAMKRACGFKSFECLPTVVIHLVAGKINIPLPTQR